MTACAIHNNNNADATINSANLSALEDLDLSNPVRVLISHKNPEWLTSVISDESTTSMKTEHQSVKQYSYSAFGIISMPNSFRREKDSWYTRLD